MCRLRGSAKLALVAVGFSLVACTSTSPSTSFPQPMRSGGDAGQSSPSAESLPAFMPDLVGQQYDDARKQLAAMNARITRRDKITNTTPGAVVEQDPLGGSPFRQNVTLTVSIAAPQVPDERNKTFGAAEVELRSFGFTVVEVPEFDDQRVDGLVLGQDPPPGTQNAQEVQLKVVRRPVVNYFSDDMPVGSSAATAGSAKANGTVYPHAVQVNAYGSQPTNVEYDLSRAYRRVIGDVALEDRTSGDTTFKVEIYGDKRLLFDATLALGQTKQVTIDVTKVLRLRLSVSRLSGSSSQGGVVFGDLRAQGLQSEIGSASPSASTSATAGSSP
jgi:hypothetical protein